MPNRASRSVTRADTWKALTMHTSTTLTLHTRARHAQHIATKLDSPSFDLF